MKTPLLAIASCLLCSAPQWAEAGPPQGGGRYAAAHGGFPAYRPGYPGYRPVYPAYRPIYPRWGAGYWGPRFGVYYGGPGYYAGPGYWGATWPYAWGAAYAAPYALAPWVVNTAPAPQVFIQQEVLPATPAPAAPTDSYWYYCTQPAGYFPYVKDCSQAWMKVVPQVPGETTTPPRLAP
jgi:hypothetical protein